MSIENMNEQKERAKPVGKEKTPFPQGAIEVDKKTFEKFVENGLLEVSTAMARYSLDLTDFDLDSIHPEESLADIKIVDPNLAFTPDQIEKDDQALFTASAVALAKARLAQKEANLTQKEKKTLDELTGKVLSSVGKALASTGGKKAMVGATTLSLMVSACNFSQTYEPPPSPTAPQIVEATEAPTFTPEPLPTSTPTETPAPFEPQAVYVSETEKEAESAENPPFYSAAAESDPFIGATDEELEEAKAEQIFRVYKMEKDLEEETSWESKESFILKMQEFITKAKPELQIGQRQSPDNASIITYIHNTETNEVLWGFTSDGEVAYPRPDFYDSNTELKGIPLLEGTIPTFRYNLDDKNWYLFAVNDEGVAEYVFLSHEANLDNMDEQWKPLSNEIFPEAYKPKYETKYILEKDGLEIPMYVAIDNKLFSKVEFKDVKLELMGELWIRANHYLYRRMKGNSEVSREDYVDLLKQGRGQVRAYYLDENSTATNGFVDPRNGFSLLITEREELPLFINPQVKYYPLYADMRVNGQGMPMIVRNTNHEAFTSEAQDLLPYGYSEETALFQVYDHKFTNSVILWGSMTPEELYAGGGLPPVPGREPEFLDEFVRPYSDFKIEFFSQLKEVLGEEKYERLLGRAGDKDDFLITLGN